MAFTLAEVLITLGIIGVVAAVTIPVLIQNHKEKRTVAQLKKVYSTLSQAFLMAKTEFGSPEEWGMGGTYDENSHTILATNMAKHMKLLSNCINSNSRECRYDYSYFDHATISKNVILQDGTLVRFRVWSGDCILGYSNPEQNITCGQIQVDLNANKKPNKYGEDIFGFYVTKNGIIPFGTKDSSLKFEKACNKSIPNPYPTFSNGDNMYACTAWVIYNENMDYLKCDDLSWDGKKTCK